jgi:hypothetical protein
MNVRVRETNLLRDNVLIVVANLKITTNQAAEVREIGTISLGRFATH